MLQQTTNIGLFYKEIKTLFNQNKLGTIKTNVRLSECTTLKIGGEVDVFILPNSIDALIKTIKILNKYKVRWIVLGRGSNVLIGDLGIRGAVISLKNFRTLNINQECISVGGGYTLTTLALKMAKLGIGGLEWACGIPASIGGAVYMNAGAYGEEISDFIERVYAINHCGELVVHQKDELKFGLRKSIYQNKKLVIYQVDLKLYRKPTQDIFKKMLKNQNHRKDTQPVGVSSAGSFFFHPPKEFAGKLIEEASLKGYRIGNIGISHKHANHVINYGKGNSDEVLRMMYIVNEKLKRLFDMKLTTEVEFIGEFERFYDDEYTYNIKRMF